MNPTSGTNLIDVADLLTEHILYSHLSHSKDYIEYFETLEPANLKAFTSILPRRKVMFNDYEISHIKHILKLAPISQREYVLHVAASSMLKICSNIGLVGSLIFKDITILGVTHKTHSVFLIDGYVLDPLHDCWFRSIRSYINELYKYNCTLRIDKRQSLYTPSDLFTFYMNNEQWATITQTTGATAKQMLAANPVWREIWQRTEV